MAQDWDIKPRADACGDCETPFEDGQRYVSALVFGSEGYVRGDYCEACWTKRSDTETPYSLWQGVFQVPPPEPEEVLKKETAESVLRRLIQTEDESKRNVIYILTVMLERKRVLVERDVQRNDDGTLMRVYEHRQSGETFLIADPELRLGELEHVQQEVLDLLGMQAPGQKADDGAEPLPAQEQDTTPLSEDKQE